MVPFILITLLFCDFFLPFFLQWWTILKHAVFLPPSYHTHTRNTPISNPNNGEKKNSKNVKIVLILTRRHFQTIFSHKKNLLLTNLFFSLHFSLQFPFARLPFTKYKLNELNLPSNNEHINHTNNNSIVHRSNRHFTENDAQLAIRSAHIRWSCVNRV